jgi:hypothetical protein
MHVSYFHATLVITGAPLLETCFTLNENKTMDQEQLHSKRIKRKKHVTKKPRQQVKTKDMK